MPCTKLSARLLPDLILSTTLRSGGIIPTLQMMTLSLPKEKQRGIQIWEAEGRDLGSGPPGVGEPSQSLKTDLPQSLLGDSFYMNPCACGRVSLLGVTCDLLDAFFLFVCFGAF